MKNPVRPSSCVTPAAVRPTNLMSRMNGKKTRTHTLSIQREGGNGTKNTRKKRRLQRKKKKHVWLSGRLHIEGRLNEGPRPQRKHKDVMTSANQAPGGHKFAPLVASQQGRANQHEPACFGVPSPWSFPSRSGIPLHAVVQPLFFSAAIHFAMKCSAPCSAVLRHSSSSWAAVVHWLSITCRLPSLTPIRS